MPFGFRVLNDWGTVLIDDTFANLALMSVNNYTTVPTTRWGGSDLTFSFTSQFPIFAFRCETAYATVISVHQNGNTYTVGMRCSGNAGTAIRVYLFDRPTVPTSGWGIRVRDENGAITFDSGYSYMRLDGVYTATSVDPPKTWTLPAGKQYAVVQGGFIYSEFWLSPVPPTDPTARGDIITEVSGVKLQGNIMEAFYYIEHVIPSQPFYNGAYGGIASYLLVDVTNMG
ncbi:hypothetical protein [Cupriavidus gilardii]|uniref:hypothetical protein n=1 Tax=Cupriavidus gilardii TaxID=82541 RepID=UPI0021B487FF|nr:hypothetical protein [Cupriavidus gilardii]UXC37202.1 hypothetical protein N4G38_07080 [Cupriavidus gilardii]